MREINKNATEMIFQTGAEMLGGIFGNGEWQYRDFPRFSGEYKDVDIRELGDKFEGAIQRAIEPYKDRRIGVLLSGGVDSTLTLYLIKKLFPEADITAYNSYFLNESISDERSFAQMGADFIGVPLKIIEHTAKMDNELLSETVKVCDAIRDATPWAYGVSKIMAEDGIEVLVNSKGVDSFLGNCGIQHRWYDSRKLKVFPVVNTKYKWVRYASILFGTDKAWFINNIAINPGKRHIKGSTLDWGKVYDEYFQDNLWITIIKWLMEVVEVNKTILFDPMCEHFGMNAAFPYLDTELLEYCIHLEPRTVYNKIPLRNLMKNVYSLPVKICNRGLNWDYGPTGKMGGGVSVNYYAGDPNYYQDLLYNIEGINFLSTIEQWILKGHKDWIKSGNRRARHLGYLIWQMQNEL